MEWVVLIKGIFKKNAIKLLGVLLKEKNIAVLKPGNSILRQCYNSGLSPVVIHCPVELCCWSLWDGKGQEGVHPLEWAARKYNEDVDEEEIAKELKTYYQVQWNKDIDSILQVSRKMVPGLSGKNILAAVYPWDKLTPEQRYYNTINNHTLKNRLRIEAIDTHDAAAELYYRAVKLELGYLFKLAKSIKEKGYLRNNKPDGDIRGELLVKGDGEGGNYRVLVRSGQHRFATLLANGEKEIPIRIFNKPPHVIRIEEVNCWPNVAKGSYTAEGAGLIFEKFFYHREV